MENGEKIIDKSSAEGDAIITGDGLRQQSTSQTCTCTHTYTYIVCIVYGRNQKTRPIQVFISTISYCIVRAQRTIIYYMINSMKS